MNYSKLASKLRGKITQFSGYVSKNLDKTARRFVGEAIYGMIYSQSVMLTEIGRSLQTRVSLKKIEERFCRQLAKPRLWETIHETVLADAAPQIRDDTLLVLDLGDLSKKYARKMQYLARVRDGSEDGEIVNGYWTTQVIGARLGSKQVLPLYQELYSQEAPDFSSENTQIIKAIDMVSESCSQRGLWIIDRGGDRSILFDHLLADEHKKSFLVRLVGDRYLTHAGSQTLALELARSCPTPYSQTIVKQEEGAEKVYHLRYGYSRVKLPDHDDQLYLLVVKGYGAKPMMLLTNRPLRGNRKLLTHMLDCYLKRWSIEQTIRFVKQTYDMENIRVLTYPRLKNMMALLLAVFYFIAIKLDTAQKLRIMTGHVLKQAKRLFGVPDFRYYALGDGLQAIFTRSPGKINNPNPYTVDPSQMGLGFP